MSLKATFTTERSSVVMKLAMAQTAKVGHGLEDVEVALGEVGSLGEATTAAVIAPVEQVAVRSVEMVVPSSGTHRWRVDG